MESTLFLAFIPRCLLRLNKNVASNVECRAHTPKKPHFNACKNTGEGYNKNGRTERRCICLEANSKTG